MCNVIEHSPRTPWPDDFPDVISFCTVGERDKHESYKRAKYAKNINQAKELMNDLQHTKGFKKAIDSIKKLGKKEDIVIVPISSLERGYDPRNKKSGVSSNPLPLAIALAIADETGWEINSDIVQSNIVGHTGADTMSRFAHPALFAGKVDEGKKYLIIDDHVSMGGTVANCRGHIESQGGKVVGIAALTANRGGMCVKLASKNRNRMTNAENFATIGCHEAIFEKVLGYPLECLTNTEAAQIIHHMEDGKAKNPQYNLQNFFGEMLQTRKNDDITNGLAGNKKSICEQKLNGTFIPKHQIVTSTKLEARVGRNGP